MNIERVRNPPEMKDELLGFVFEVYRSTNGAYPALEWVARKPSPDDFEGFRRVYEPFLEFRLEKEFDELYVLRECGKTITGTVALVYNFMGKRMWWVPAEITGKRTGLVEFLMVHPGMRGRGLGSMLLNFAVKRLEELGKKAYIVTFPDIDAYGYYLRAGFKKFMDYGRFVVLKKP